MKCLTQWTTVLPVDWQELTPDVWAQTRRRAEPSTSRGRMDADIRNPDGAWVYALNVQGVVFEGYDHYAIEPLPGEDGLIVSVWNDDVAETPADERLAMVWRFRPLAPDPTLGGAYNTRQEMKVYAAPAAQQRMAAAGHDARPWEEFTLPPLNVTRHGAWISDVLAAQHVSTRAERGYKSWTENAPHEELDVVTGELRDQRAVGRYKPSEHTITFYQSDLARASGVHAATGAEPALMLSTGPAGTITRSVPLSTSELAFCFTAGSTDPSAIEENDWPAGTYRCQLDVNAAGANLTFGLLTVGSAAGHFGRVDAALTADLETWVQSEAAFSGTGLKLASAYKDPAAGGGSGSDRLECLVAVNNASGAGAQSLTLNVNGASSFADGPWTPKPINAAMGTFLIPTSATVGTQITVAGLGFTPSIIFTFWNGADWQTTQNGRLSYWRGQGWACSPTDRRCGCVAERDAFGGAGTGTWRHRNDSIVCVGQSTGLSNPFDGGLLDLDHMTNDGFVTIVDEQFTHDTQYGPNRDVLVMYVAIGGPGIANAGTFTFNEPNTVLGSQDVGSPNFEPSVVISQMFGQRGSDANDESGHELFVTGAAVRGKGAVKRWMLVTTGQDAAEPTITAAYMLASEFIGFCNTGAMAFRADFTRMLQVGFRLNVLESDSGRQAEALCINGGNWDVGDFLTRTDTADIVVSGLGFAPKVIIFQSVCRAASTPDTITDENIYSFGISQGPSKQHAMATFSKDNAAGGGGGGVGAQSSAASDFENVYIRFANDHSVVGRMKVKSIEPDGFVCVMSDPDPSAAFVGYIAFGDASERGFRGKQSEFPKTMMRRLA